MLASRLLREQEVLKHSEKKINFKALNLTFSNLRKDDLLSSDDLNLFIRP